MCRLGAVVGMLATIASENEMKQSVTQRDLMLRVLRLNCDDGTLGHFWLTGWCESVGA